ncbi:hypothetical protein COU57_05300 [Candidatus Pacearchaeota archaeon CG10_big_fil_rev_8_21_14_0_10_32_14]|nr:MAG: hypothetical protein COU57_05300 [Candidatus Pacearchaeota archaeon CG10_big_fil_rev_8_21_14_0_10_32_14]
MKRKVLVMASTFARWKDDTLPPFVYELSKKLTSTFDIIVLAPSYPASKDFETMDNMKVYRFHYFFKKYEKLAGSGGILPTLKKNKWYYFQVPFFLMGEFFALRKRIKEDNPDIIHAHWILPQGLIAYLNYKISRKKVGYVVTSHGSDIMGLKGFLFLKKAILKNAKKINVASNAIKKEILENIDSSLTIEVIPMGIDTDLFNEDKKDISLKKKNKIDGPFLLYVGRIAPEKGIDLLIEAMPEVINKFPEVKLMIIGEGTIKEEIVNRVDELNIKNKIIFMGWVDNKKLPKYYATADVFVCPSRREGSPVSYIESLACGTPLVVGDIPISNEIIKNKEMGLVVKHNPEDVSKGIISVISMKNKKRFNSEIKKNYDHKVIVKKFEEVLR